MGTDSKNESILNAIKSSDSVIENPIEARYLDMVRGDGLLIVHIDNPSEAVCLEAVRNNGMAIKYIENPSYEVCLEAIKNNGLAIQYIENPSEDLCLEAVSSNYRSIKYIKNPSKVVCLTAFNSNKNALWCIDRRVLRSHGLTKLWKPYLVYLKSSLTIENILRIFALPISLYVMYFAYYYKSDAGFTIGIVLLGFWYLFIID